MKNRNIERKYYSVRYDILCKQEKFMDNFKRTKFVSGLLRFMNPGYGTCKKCGLPWNQCKEKTVHYDEYNGIFATCDYCWYHSTLDELKEYYTSIYIRQTFKNTTLKNLLECVEKEYNEKKMNSYE